MRAQEHARGLEAARRWLESEGYTLDALPPTGSHVADLYGFQHNQGIGHEILVAVETSGAITSHAAAERMQALCAWADALSSREAVVFVPLDDLEQAIEVFQEYTEIRTY